MKKLFLLVALGVGLVTNIVKADYSVTTVVPTGVLTNVARPFGAAYVKSVTIASAASAAANVTLIDSITNQATYTVPAFTNVTWSLTNYVYNYTNFYGYVENYTNTAIVNVTNSIAAATYSYYPRFSATVGTNTTSYFNNLNINYGNGVYATNAGTGSATVTVVFIPLQ